MGSIPACYNTFLSSIVYSYLLIHSVNKFSYEDMLNATHSEFRVSKGENTVLITDCIIVQLGRWVAKHNYINVTSIVIETLKQCDSLLWNTTGQGKK